MDWEDRMLLGIFIVMNSPIKMGRRWWAKIDWLMHRFVVERSLHIRLGYSGPKEDGGVMQYSSSIGFDNLEVAG